MSTAYYLQNGRWATMSITNLVVPLIFGLIASFVMVIITMLNLRVDEKVARLRAADQENERLRRLESEARLASLQAKLNPHFLFNTLNSVAALVYDDPEKAEQGILRLAEVYRHVLAISHRQWVTLAEELRLIGDYLALERLRFEDRLHVTIDCAQSLANVSIPGLILEPLVGNVIKHGLERTDRSVTLVIRAEAGDGRLRLTVQDNGPGFDPLKVTSGYGHLSIRERMGMVYGTDFNLSIHSQPGEGVIAMLDIPLNGPGGARP